MFYHAQARRDREEQEKMKAQESLKSAQQHSNKLSHQDHSIGVQNSAGSGGGGGGGGGLGGHHHHSIVQNDLKLGLGGMNVGGNQLGTWCSGNRVYSQIFKYSLWNKYSIPSRSNIPTHASIQLIIQTTNTIISISFLCFVSHSTRQTPQLFGSQQFASQYTTPRPSNPFVQRQSRQL